MDVAASEFYNEKDQTYDLNFKEEVILVFFNICTWFVGLYSVTSWLLILVQEI